MLSAGPLFRFRTLLRRGRCPTTWRMFQHDSRRGMIDVARTFSSPNLLGGKKHTRRRSASETGDGSERQRDPTTAHRVFRRASLRSPFFSRLMTIAGGSLQVQYWYSADLVTAKKDVGEAESLSITCHARCRAQRCAWTEASGIWFWTWGALMKSKHQLADTGTFA